MAMTPFERCGGFARVRHIVSAFYDRVLDELVCHHFAGIDMARLVDHQTKFIAGLMGGPYRFDEGHLRRVHAHLGITPAQFQRMSELLGETFADFALPAADIDSVLAAMARCQPLIVAKAA